MPVRAVAACSQQCFATPARSLCSSRRGRQGQRPPLGVTRSNTHIALIRPTVPSNYSHTQPHAHYTPTPTVRPPYVLPTLPACRPPPPPACPGLRITVVDVSHTPMGTGAPCMQRGGGSAYVRACMHSMQACARCARVRAHTHARWKSSHHPLAHAAMHTDMSACMQACPRLQTPRRRPQPKAQPSLAQPKAPRTQAGHPTTPDAGAAGATPLRPARSGSRRRQQWPHLDRLGTRCSGSHLQLLGQGGPLVPDAQLQVPPLPAPAACHGGWVEWVGLG